MKQTDKFWALNSLIEKVIAMGPEYAIYDHVHCYDENAGAYTGQNIVPKDHYTGTCLFEWRGNGWYGKLCRPTDRHYPFAKYL